ncbi:SRPBCC family protein [Niveibacterium sp. SC-1]|uniref:SRPBCC family protein n=1 Tax=Niveibacterium sp. SC-1 TaxID=3135646 RepID=UPI00311F489E
MLIALVLGVALLVGALLILAALRPGYFVVQHSTTIEAPPDTVFALIDDFREWASWSPWEGRDPALRREFGGAPRGRGARYAWTGRGGAGVGRMEILAATSGSEVRIALELDAPVRFHKRVDFTLQPRGRATQVTWSMQGMTPFKLKLLRVLHAGRASIDHDFQRGLAAMKAAAESRYTAGGIR